MSDARHWERLSTQAFTQRHLLNFVHVDGQAIDDVDAFGRGHCRRGHELPYTDWKEGRFLARKLFVVPLLLQYIGVADYDLEWPAGE